MLLALLLATHADAKDLRSRFGLGFHQGLAGTPTSALSARYGLPAGKPITNIQIEVDAGLDLAEGVDPKVFVGARLLDTVVAEDNMNFYLGAGAGYKIDGAAGVVRLQPALGAEFFLFGLENLGLSAEWAVNVDLGAAWAVSTGPSLGMHYYF